MPVSYKAHRDWTHQRPLDWGERIGKHFRQTVEHQMTHKPIRRLLPLCLGHLSLARHYGIENLETAPGRALQQLALNTRTVRNVLKQGLDQQPQPKVTADA